MASTRKRVPPVSARGARGSSKPSPLLCQSRESTGVCVCGRVALFFYRCRRFLCRADDDDDTTDDERAPNRFEPAPVLYAVHVEKKKENLCSNRRRTPTLPTVVVGNATAR